jgi:hypothetical protein
MSQGPDPITLADRGIQNLRIEYEKFFNGAASVPPDTLRLSVAAQIKKLRTSKLSSVDSFRVNSIEAKYNSYSEMFERRLRRLEEGRSIRPRRTAVAASEEARPDPQKGVRLGQSLDRQGVEALFQGLYSGKSNVDLESFRSHLAKNLAAIRQRTGCSEAEFRLVNEDGKAKLKVKPIAASRAAATKE